MAEVMQADGTYIDVPDEEIIVDEGNRDVEKNARMMGWVPKEEFKGPDSSWIDADTFVERGTQIMPMLQKNNERLLRNMESVNTRLSSTESELRATKAALAAIEETQEEATQQTLKDTKLELVNEIARASADGDHAGLAAATAKLLELGADQPIKRKLEEGAGGRESGQGQIHPEVAQWYSEHPRFAPTTREKALAQGIALEMRAAGDARVGRAFLDDVAAELDKTLGRGDNGGGVSKVSGGNGGSGRGGGGGSVKKTFADLPADARAACEKMIPRFVGENKRYKDAASWRSAYVAKYDWEGA